jgi:hypothetical protein
MQLSKDTIKKLSNNTRKTSVSIFFPTYVAGKQVQQNSIRCKNNLNTARERLIEMGMRSPEADAILEPAMNLVNDTEFWRHQSHGLALFLTEDSFDYYRLPWDVEELVVVSDRFHLKPLMPWLINNDLFYILALSKNQVRLLQGSHYTVAPVEIEDLPSSLAEALQYDDPEEQLDYHNVSDSSGSPVSIYSGQGGATEGDKNRILRYFQKIDSGLQEFLGGQNIPLILAGVEYLLPIYREANSYPHLLENGITGNPDILKPEELHSQAWPIAKEHFDQQRTDAMQVYHNVVGTGQASANLEDVLSAAENGQIDTLFVTLPDHCWGHFDAEKRNAEVHAERVTGDDDLLDVAAVKTFLQSGTVYAVDREDMPNKQTIAAVFRYAISEGQSSGYQPEAIAY